MATTGTNHTGVAPGPGTAANGAVPAERGHTAVPPMYHDEHKSHVKQVDKHAFHAGHHEIPARGATYLGLTLLLLAFALAGILTHVYIAEVGATKSKINLWKLCTEENLGGSLRNSTCRDIDDGVADCYMARYNALRAFGIMTLIVAFFVCIPLAIFDLFHELPPRTGRHLMAAMALVLFVFTLIYWAIVVAMWDNGCDGGNAYKDIAGSRYGASGPLFIVAWVLSMCMLMAALVLPGVEYYHPHKHAEVAGASASSLSPNPNPAVVQMQPTNARQPNPAYDPTVPVTTGGDRNSELAATRNEPIAAAAPATQPVPASQEPMNAHAVGHPTAASDPAIVADPNHTTA